MRQSDTASGGEVGAPAPKQIEGYGLGLTAPGRDLMQTAAGLRERGLSTSGVIQSRAVADRVGERGWRVVQVAGLLPDPFPARFTTRPPGAFERMSAPALSALVRVPAIAGLAMRRAGGSMVVITAYDFDFDSWRGTVPAGPRVVEVEIGVGNLGPKWEVLGPLDGPRVLLDPDGPIGVRRLTLVGDGWPPGRPPSGNRSSDPGPRD